MTFADVCGEEFELGKVLLVTFAVVCADEFELGVIPYENDQISKCQTSDHLGFSSFLDMLVDTIKELYMQNLSFLALPASEIRPSENLAIFGD